MPAPGRVAASALAESRRDWSALLSLIVVAEEPTGGARGEDEGGWVRRMARSGKRESAMGWDLVDEVERCRDCWRRRCCRQDWHIEERSGCGAMLHVPFRDARDRISGALSELAVPAGRSRPESIVIGDVKC